MKNLMRKNCSSSTLQTSKMEYPLKSSIHLVFVFRSQKHTETGFQRKMAEEYLLALVKSLRGEGTNQPVAQYLQLPNAPASIFYGWLLHSKRILVHSSW